MSGYATLLDYFRALPRLIESGATLRTLYDEMLTIQEKDAVNVSPAWLRVLASSWMQWPAFVPIRLSELFGGLTVKHDDDYVLAMIGTLGDRHEPGIREHLLRHDHALRDDVFWRIFEVEGGGEISLANIDKFSAAAAGWQSTVLTLVADGTLDRARVLRCCLQALNRDFSAYRAGWFSRVYAALEPSAFEAAADQDLLRLTLGSTISASVSLAARQLAAIHKAGLLDAPAFTQACGPALTGPKAAALGVLKMLAAIAAKKQADADTVAQTIALAAAHPHHDVQRAAVAALLKLGRADLVRASAGLLAPAVAAELLPAQAAAPTPPNQLPASPAPLSHAAAPRPWTNDNARERCAVLLEDATAAQGFAVCAPAIALTRWAEAFADAAAIAPFAAIDTLAALLPSLPAKAHGLGALLTVLLDETTRHRRLPASGALAAWLDQFGGASATAKTARAIRALVETKP